MKKQIPEIEKKSKNNFLVKVRPSRNSFVIFRPDGSPERLNKNDPNLIHNNLKTLTFVGKLFKLRSAYTDLSFLPVSNHRIIVPYKHQLLPEEKAIVIHTVSESDLFPMIINTIETIEDLFMELKRGSYSNYLALDDSITREQIVKVKQKMPNTYVFVIKVTSLLNQQKNEQNNQVSGEKVDESHLRAIDLMNQAGHNIELYSNNPVFLARIFLRNMELSKMKSMLMEKDVTQEENRYIQEFLDIMIRNEFNKADLTKHKNELQLLKNYCQILLMFDNHDLDEISDRIQLENNKEILNFYHFLLQRFKDAAHNKEEEIKFWELGAVVKTRIEEINEKKAIKT